jgi:hypothetical protein
MNSPQYIILNKEKQFFGDSIWDFKSEYPEARKFSSKREAIKIARRLPINDLRVIKNYGLMDEEIVREIE